MFSKAQITGISVFSVLLIGTFIWLGTEDQGETYIKNDAKINPEYVAPALVEKTQSAPKAALTTENSGEPEEDLSQTSSDWNAAEFAPSLADTDIDGALAVDEHGNLAITLDLKDFYDYFFSAVGERTEEEVYAEIERQIASRLDGEAASQAIALMYDYVDYQRAQQELMAQKLVAKDLQDYEYYAKTMSDAFYTLKEFRREYFSPEVADAFFALDEIHAEYAVTVLEIQANPSLSDEQKQAHIQSIETQLPESMRAAAKETDERAQLAAEARALYDGGGSPEEVHALLSDKYEPEVIDNMLAYYEREAQWQDRLDQYFTEKSAIVQSGLSEDDQSTAILALQDKMFESDELNRLGSEEAIARELAEAQARETSSS